MSIASYRRNVSKRVTGINTPTCFPAALEQISPRHSYRADIYRDYSSFVDWFCTLTLKQRDEHVSDYEDMVSHLVKPLGGFACEDIQFSRATTTSGFLRVVRPLLRDGFQVTVDISRSGGSSATVHTVGLLPAGHETDHISLVSTHIPKCLQGIVDLRTVASHLAVVEETYLPGHPLNNANIAAVPPLD
jgi:hypothetical protein